MKFELFLQIFEKYSNMNFIKLLPVGAELFHDDVQMNKRMDRHNEHYVFLTMHCDIHM
jgi:hypothetical protein